MKATDYCLQLYIKPFLGIFLITVDNQRAHQLHKESVGRPRGKGHGQVF